MEDFDGRIFPLLLGGLVPFSTHIFSFSCTLYLVHNITGSQYLEYVAPGTLLLAGFVSNFTGFRLDYATPKKFERGLFAPVFASIIVIVIVIDFLGFSVR